MRKKGRRAAAIATAFVGPTIGVRSSRWAIRGNRTARVSNERFLSEFGFRNGPSRVDEPDVAEGLRKVAQEFSADGIDLLGEEADVVDEGCRTLEDGAGTSRLSPPGQGLCQPKRAQKEGAFFALEPVVGPIPIHQSPLIGQTFFGRVDGG